MNRKRLMHELTRDFGAAEFLCRVYRQAGCEPPEFCGSELVRIWKEAHRHKFTWLERQVIFGRIEIVH